MLVRKTSVKGFQYTIPTSPLQDNYYCEQPEPRQIDWNLGWIGNWNRYN